MVGESKGTGKGKLAAMTRKLDYHFRRESRAYQLGYMDAVDKVIEKARSSMDRSTIELGHELLKAFIDENGAAEIRYRLNREEVKTNEKA